MMLQDDLSFLEDPKQCVTFYYSLAVQYLRTNHLKKSRLIMSPERFDMYLRIANPLMHILANNMGLSLYASRKLDTLTILTNNTTIPFVTADQPIINMAANPKKTDPPKRSDLYYPLSPTKALLILDPNSEFLPAGPCASDMSVEVYNLRMAAHSHRQVLSNSKQVLEAVRSNLPAYLSCFEA